MELAGAFHNDFWISHILPLARHEASVRHAIIAMSSMHEHYSGVDHYSPTKGVDFALEHYGKAMREVVRFNRSNPSQSFEFALVTCALFSTFESLQGQYHAACSHAVAGIKILAEEQRRLASNELQTRIPRDALTRFFIATSRQIYEMGDSNFPNTRPDLFYTRTTIPLPDHFTSYEHVLLHMEIILGELFEYIEKAQTYGKQGPIPEDIGLALMTEFHTHKMQFEKWKTAFESFSATNSNEFSRETPESTSSSTASSPSDQPHPPRNPSFLILKIYYFLASAFLERIECNDESVFDAFALDLWTALDATEEFIHSTSTYVNPLDKTSPTRTPLDPNSWITAQRQTPLPAVIRPTFSLALGVVPTLFVTATRSSIPAVRDKALHLLRTCNRREGLWDSNLSARLVDRILQLRKIAAQLSLPPNTSLDLDTLTTNLRNTNLVPLSPAVPSRSSSSVSAAPPGTTLKDLSIASDPNAIDFQLLDINFLPGRKCAFRYTFIRHDGRKLFRDGDEEQGEGLGVVDAWSTLVPAARRFQGEFWETMSWEEV